MFALHNFDKISDDRSAVAEPQSHGLRPARSRLVRRVLFGLPALVVAGGAGAQPAC